MPARDYSDEPFKVFRQKVRKRDNYMCQMPGCKSKKHLQVHHIRPWAKNPNLRYDPNNGIVLCKYHHKSINGQEHIYASMFEEIVYEKTH